jgi:hypothetical protein
MLVLFLILLCAPALAADLSSRDWTATATKSLTSEDINKIITKALGADWTVKVCNFRFDDLAHDGSLRLVAAFDGSGYHTCNRVIVIEKNGAHFVKVNDWQTRLAQKIQNILGDFDGDGHPEIIIPETWSKYEPGRCIAMWQKLYRWEDGRFVNHSMDYPQLYQARQKELAALIPRLRDSTCEQMERDKISRFLGLSPSAGYKQALIWMQDSQGFMRRKAAAVFADINDGESRKNLATLKDDRDALVAETARGYLEALVKH